MATNFDKDKPAGTQKIRLSDEEIRANWAAIEDAIGRNHNFPGNESSDAGQHQIVEIEDNAADPSAEASMIKLYNDADVLKARLAGGRIVRLETEIQTLAKTSAYTALLADFGKCILVTNTTTITLTAAATLGDGWYIYIKNNGTDTVTIDGNASETIDGALTVSLATEDDTILIVCDGSNFHTLSLYSTISLTHDHSSSSTGGLIDVVTNIPYIRLHDSKATTTDGGTFTQGDWRKRTVTEDQDTGSNVSVASSVITLEAGTYDCLIRCPAFRVDSHQVRLRNTTDGATTLVGSSAFTNDVEAVQTDSFVQGRFTIAAQKTFEIQHRCSNTQATFGFGAANDFGENEIYTVAEFWKVA